MAKVVLVIPDLHCPYHHPQALAFLRQVKKTYSPTHVVVIGDEVDAYAFSRYDHDPDAISAGDELEAAIVALEPFYAEFPLAKVCNSNHVGRLQKRAVLAGLPKRCIRPIRDILGAPEGWQWRDNWTLDKVFYTHGDGFSGAGAALKAALGFRSNTVIGHIHAHAGVQYSAGVRDVIWGMNVGCLIDDRSLAFAYGRHLPARPTLGCGVVVDGVPHFIPLR